MPNFTPTIADTTDGLSVGRCRWIDALLIVGGATCVLARVPVVGVPLLGLGLVSPLRQWSGRGRDACNVAHLVPAELAAGHREVVAAAALPGVLGAPEVVHAADDAILEVAALLGGRSPRGGAQRRFVAARLKALMDVASELRERHDAWVAARAEIDAIAAVSVPEEPRPQRTGLLVSVLVVVLVPAFLAWDVLTLAVRILAALLDGLALRLRTAARLVAGAGHGAVVLAMRARRAWDRGRNALVVAATEAHHRVAAARVRLRLRLRRARREIRRVRDASLSRRSVQ